MRREVKLAEGRWFRPGSNELVAGIQMARRFQGAGLGETLRFAMRTWRIVGIMDAGNTGFSSEIWGDVEQLLQAFRRTAFSSVIMRLQDPMAFPELKARLEADPRLPVQVRREVEFYEAQSKRLADFIRILGMVLTGIFGLGAVLGGHGHHVRPGGGPDRRNRHHAGPGFSPAGYLARLSGGGGSPGAGRLGHRPDSGLPAEFLYPVHHELVQLCRDSPSASP